MSKTPRRKFLKQSVAALSALGLPACRGVSSDALARAALRVETLQALGEVVLPAAELKPQGVTRIVAGFEEWLREFEPVAEMDHPYLDSSEIRYGSADPGPRWQSQLDALEMEAQKKYSKSFRELDRAVRRELVERQIRNDRLDRLPAIAEAQHVALGLLAYFYSTPEANDLCYEAAIERWACRGLETAPQKPAPLSKRG